MNLLILALLLLQIPLVSLYGIPELDNDDEKDLVSLVEHTRRERKAAMKPLLPLKVANDQFLQCCKKARMDKSCYKLCRYDVGPLKLSMGFFMGKCGFTSIVPWLGCANGNDNGSNNTDCCQQSGVLKGAGKACKPLCEQNPSMRPDRKLFTCAWRYKKILRCHHQGLKLAKPDSDDEF